MRKKQTDRERDSNRERDREIEIVLTIRERIGDSEIFFILIGIIGIWFP